MTFFPLSPVCLPPPRVSAGEKSNQTLIAAAARWGSQLRTSRVLRRNVNCGWLSPFFFCSSTLFQAWRRYDTDRSGYIEANELKVWRNTLNRATLYNVSKASTSFIRLTHVYSHFSFLPSFILIQMHIARVTKQPLFHFCLFITLFFFVFSICTSMNDSFVTFPHI